MAEPYWQDDAVTLHLGDCLEVLAEMEASSVDAIVTDPPYGLEFMGKNWDAPWIETGINRDAGFKGGGVSATKGAPTFTSSTNPNCINCGGKQRGRRDGTAIVAVCICDSPRFPNTRATEMRAFQEWCEQWAAQCLRVLKPGGYVLAFGGTRTSHRLTCGIEDAGFEIRDSIHWIYGSGFPKSLNLGDGLGTALKPAHEPIVVARKPPAGTVAANVLQHGTGALNVNGCRVPTNPADAAAMERANTPGSGRMKSGGSPIGTFVRSSATGAMDTSAGRWPPNVVLGPEAAAELDRQSGVMTSRIGSPRRSAAPGNGYGMVHTGAEYEDSGGASRFFPVFRYEPKAANAERPRGEDGTAHPTVKPVDLMAWLVRLVTPPGGTVLDPFAGSGTTAEACIVEGFRCVLIEKDPAYAELIRTRLRKPIQPAMFGEVS